MMYCRCSTFSPSKVTKHITFPAYLQLKCDGSYREAQVITGKSVKFFSRAGKEYSNPILEEQMLSLPTGSYLGEWTIGEADSPNKNRFEGNGLLNSHNPPYNEIIFTVWDYLTQDEKRPYMNRFEHIKAILKDYSNIRVVNSTIVKSIAEALALTKVYMGKGLEGGILKDFNYKFIDGTSLKQYKIKLQLDADMRISGFSEGTGKRKEYFGAIEFSNDEGTITGSCSGFTDQLMKQINSNRDAYIGKIITVEFNDVIHQKGKYTLNHPRFLCFREDKTSTDSLQRVLDIKKMSTSI